MNYAASSAVMIVLLVMTANPSLGVPKLPKHCRLPDKNDALAKHMPGAFEACSVQTKVQHNIDRCSLEKCALDRLGILDSDGFPVGKKYADLLIPVKKYPETNAFYSSLIDMCAVTAMVSSSNLEACKKSRVVLECAQETFEDICYV